MRQLVHISSHLTACCCLHCVDSYPLEGTPAEIGYSLRRGRGGSLDCMWGVQWCAVDLWHATTKSETTVGAGNQTRISRS